jgi:hypothetical protein
MKLIHRIRLWLRGEAHTDQTDPAARADAQRIRDDVETRRTGTLTGQDNIVNRGKDSTGRGDW